MSETCLVVANTFPILHADKRMKIWSTAILLDDTLERHAALRRPLFVGTTHEAAVHCARFSSDGRYVASGDDNGLVVIWELKPGKPQAAMGETDRGSENWTPVFLLKGHTDEVQDVCWSPGGRYLATASLDERVMVWAISREQAGSAAVKPAAGKAKHATTGNVGSRTITKPLVVLSGHDGSVQGLSWDPFGRILVSTGNDKRVVLWRAGDDSRELPLGDAAPSRKGQEGKHQRLPGKPKRSTGANEPAPSSSSSASASGWRSLRSSSLPYQDCVSEGDIRRLDFSCDGLAVATGHALVSDAYTAPLLSRQGMKVSRHLCGFIRPVSTVRCSNAVLMDVGSAVGRAASSSASMQVPAAITTFPCYATGTLDGSIAIWKASSETDGNGAGSGAGAGAASSSSAAPVGIAATSPLAVLASVFAAPVSDIAWACAPDAAILADCRSKVMAASASASSAAASASISAAGGNNAGAVPWRDVYASTAPQSCIAARSPFILAASQDGSVAVVVFDQQSTAGRAIGSAATADGVVNHLSKCYGISVDSIQQALANPAEAVETSTRRWKLVRRMHERQQRYRSAERMMDESYLDDNDTDSEVGDGEDSQWLSDGIQPIDAADVVLFLARRQLLYGPLADCTVNPRAGRKSKSNGAVAASFDAVSLSFVPEVPDIVLQTTAPHLAHRLRAALHPASAAVPTLSSSAPAIAPSSGADVRPVAADGAGTGSAGAVPSATSAAAQQQKESKLKDGKRRIAPLMLAADGGGGMANGTSSAATSAASFGDTAISASAPSSSGLINGVNPTLLSMSAPQPSATPTLSSNVATNDHPEPAAAPAATSTAPLPSFSLGKFSALDAILSGALSRSTLVTLSTATATTLQAADPGASSSSSASATAMKKQNQLEARLTGGVGLGQLSSIDAPAGAQSSSAAAAPAAPLLSPSFAGMLTSIDAWHHQAFSYGMRSVHSIIADHRDEVRSLIKSQRRSRSASPYGSDDDDDGSDSSGSDSASARSSSMSRYSSGHRLQGRKRGRDKRRHAHHDTRRHSYPLGGYFPAYPPVYGGYTFPPPYPHPHSHHLGLSTTMLPPGLPQQQRGFADMQHQQHSASTPASTTQVAGGAYPDGDVEMDGHVGGGGDGAAADGVDDQMTEAAMREGDDAMDGVPVVDGRPDRGGTSDSRRPSQVAASLPARAPSRSASLMHQQASPGAWSGIQPPSQASQWSAAGMSQQPQPQHHPQFNHHPFYNTYPNGYGLEMTMVAAAANTSQASVIAAPQKPAPASTAIPLLPMPPATSRLTCKVELGERKHGDGVHVWHASASGMTAVDPYDASVLMMDEGDDTKSATSQPSHITCTPQGDAPPTSSSWVAEGVRNGSISWQTPMQFRPSVILTAQLASGVQLVIVGGHDGGIVMLDAATGKPVCRPILFASAAVRHLAVRSNAGDACIQLLATACDGTMTLWDVDCSPGAAAAGGGKMKPKRVLQASVAPVVSAINAAASAGSSTKSTVGGIAAVTLLAEAPTPVVIAIAPRPAAAGSASSSSAAAGGAFSRVRYLWDADAQTWTS